MLVVISLISFLFVALFTARAYRNNTPTGSGQSRRGAIVEAWTNIGIGFSINFVANSLILPLANASVTPLDNFLIGWIYTAVSMIRQYAIRRWFNDRIHRLATQLGR